MAATRARLDASLRRTRPTAFAAAVWRKAGDDHFGYLALLLAAYAFLSAFPLLLVLATVLGIVLRDHPNVQQEVMHSALTDFPVIGTQLRTNIHSLGGTGFGLGIGLIATAWGAHGLATSTQFVFNTVWAVPYTRRPGWLVRQARGAALLAVVAVDVTVTGALSSVSGVGVAHGLPVQWLGAIASTVISALLFTLGFRLATAPQIPVRDFVRSACAAAVVWQCLLSLGTFLLDHELRHAEDLYGVFGLVLGLLAWLTVQARVTLLLLEADCVRARRLWPRTLLGDGLLPGDRTAFDDLARTQQRRPGMRIEIAYEPPAPGVVVTHGPPAPGAASAARKPRQHAVEAEPGRQRAEGEPPVTGQPGGAERVGDGGRGAAHQQ
jgi:uncharacterized BrkB/YihY/UPF0761 family membrane protein